jgi:hypothetical protein
VVYDHLKIFYDFEKKTKLGDDFVSAARIFNERTFEQL